MSSNPQPIPLAPSTQTNAAAKPFPALFFECMTSFRQGAALKAAIELDLFTVLGEASQSAESLALRIQASVRGVRILCDYLTSEGFLLKDGGRYSASADAAMFLNRKSRMFIGSAALFLANPMLLDNFRDLAGCVRKGGTLSEGGTITPDNPIWVEFARYMAPVAAMDAELVAQLLPAGDHACKVLDIAAGHGMYGIALARRNRYAEVVALDWKNVLNVAKENAEKAGVDSRYSTIEGSAFDRDFGEGYDIVLLTNFLHHFNPLTNESLLRKVHRALKPGGIAVTLELVPDESRVTPQVPAEFSLVMLATTPEGDTYTFSELENMFRNAGFRSAELYEIPPSMHRVVIAVA